MVLQFYSTITYNALPIRVLLPVEEQRVSTQLKNSLPSSPFESFSSEEKDIDRTIPRNIFTSSVIGPRYTRAHIHIPIPSLRYSAICSRLYATFRLLEKCRTSSMLSRKRKWRSSRRRSLSSIEKVRFGVRACTCLSDRFDLRPHPPYTPPPPPPKTHFFTSMFKHR